MSCVFSPLFQLLSSSDLMHVFCSTKLDAEKRLALQQEKEALETKLLEVYVDIFYIMSFTGSTLYLQTEDEGKARRAACCG